VITINPLVRDKLPYDPAHDLVAIASIVNNSFAIAVSETLKVASLEDFVKLARAQPGKLNWAATSGSARQYLRRATVDALSQTSSTCRSWLPRADRLRGFRARPHGGHICCFLAGERARALSFNTSDASKPDKIDASRTPSRTCAIMLSSSNASVPMKRLMVNPTPVRIATP
jgi:hypothetical protein